MLFNCEGDRTGDEFPPCLSARRFPSGVGFRALYVGPRWDPEATLPCISVWGRADWGWQSPEQKLDFIAKMVNSRKNYMK